MINDYEEHLCLPYFHKYTYIIIKRPDKCIRSSAKHMPYNYRCYMRFLSYIMDKNRQPISLLSKSYYYPIIK